MGTVAPYDAFGNLISSTGSTPNHYRYAGEQFDSDLGLYYNRARYLDVRTARFWTVDPFDGRASDPLSLHKYSYGAGNPVHNVDPSGQETLAGINVAQAAALVLLSAITVLTLTRVCEETIRNLGAEGPCRIPDDNLLFYHGTSFLDAEEIVATQQVNYERVLYRQVPPGELGAGFYMSRSILTAHVYADRHGGFGRQGGPGIVSIAIGRHPWEDPPFFLASAWRS